VPFCELERYPRYNEAPNATMTDRQDVNLPTLADVNGDLPSRATSFTSAFPLSSDNNIADSSDPDQRLDTLEQSGRYLLSIPRYDVRSLQSCPEYRQFLDALEKLGEAHRRVVFMRNCEIQVQSSSSDEEGEAGEGAGFGESSQDASFNISADRCGLKSPTLDSASSSCGSSVPYSPTPASPPSGASQRKSLRSILASASLDTSEGDLPPLEDPHPSASRRNRLRPSTIRQNELQLTGRPYYSLLQHIPSDDELLRILEYLNCRNLIHMGNTCHRFHGLSEQSAVQRTDAYATDGMAPHSPARNRLGAAAVAAAAADGADAEEADGGQDNDNLVPVDIGVGHLFIPLGGHAEPAIPPASPTRSAAALQRGAILPGGSASPMHLLRAYEQAEGISPRTGPFVRMPFLGLPRRVEVSRCGDEEFNGIYFCTGCNGNGFVFTKPREPRLRVRAVTPTEVVAANAPAVAADEFEDAVSNNQQGEAAPRSTESSCPGRLLRINISKKFSDQTILWYMSKEIEAIDDNGDPSIAQAYCFWAKLMARGQGSSGDSMYPSQTSTMMRTGDRAWGGLGMMRDTAPPVVELLD